MSSMPFISVIIPVFNAERYLERCVRSILAQSYLDFDLYLVNDSSKDGSGTLCDSLAAEDERARVIHFDQNRGVSAARNRGMAEADGTWLCFIDADDWVTPSYLQELADAVTDGSCDLVIGGIRSVYPGDREVYAVPEPMELAPGDGKTAEWLELFRSFLMFGPVVKLYRKQLLQRHAICFPEDISFGEDLIFNLDYLKRCRRLRTIGKAGYVYRREEKGTLSTRYMPQKFAWIVQQFHLVRDYFRDTGLRGEAVEHYLALRWWGQVYDSLFEVYGAHAGISAAQRYRAVRAIVLAPENELLRRHPEAFPCARWIKFCLFHQMPLCLFVLLEAACRKNR